MSLKGLENLAQLAVSSEYLMQVTLDPDGKVLSSDSGIGPIPSLFDQSKKQIFFADCFLSSDWVKYENNRTKAWNNHQQSFFVDLQKINYPNGNLLKTRWEFFFISKEHGTCLGIGHPLDVQKPYDIQLGELMDASDSPQELLDTILEDRLLGFWEFNPYDKSNSISSGLAQILGYSEKDMNQFGSITWENHIHPEDFENLRIDLFQHFRSAGTIPFKREFRLITKQNQTIWVVGFGKTTKWNERGLPSHVQGLIVDINERKKQELWLKEHHFFLKDLAFQQSHTLRARVANILGLIDILELEQQSFESKRIVEIIKKETKDLDHALKKSIKESVNQNKVFESETGNTAS
ncbi:MAG: PAS domain-containing protein [Algoriphagus sp.]|uniref:PAS domain-containing protein n=1 Tax=Algoriphagus sp. TaxID=1872435 RepID=UPI0017F0CD52|nr:PAS domain-containing protein [Algoriphagus sp.]NVJ85135.1 PAS domain-containing protein [Algoriphagus sp.]